MGLQSVAGTSSAVVLDVQYIRVSVGTSRANGIRRAIPNFQRVNVRAYVMRNKRVGRTKPVPAKLTEYVHLNQKYQVLVCIGCREAVRPCELVGHLEQFHKVGVGRVRDALIRYIGGFKHDYEPLTVKNPADWSAPQEKIRVIRGWLCEKCGFRSKSRERVQVHGYKKHGLERASVDTIIVKVQLQTWFNRPPRYWVINDVEVETGGRSGGPDTSKEEGSKKIQADGSTTNVPSRERV